MISIHTSGHNPVLNAIRIISNALDRNREKNNYRKEYIAREETKLIEAGELVCEYFDVNFDEVAVFTAIFSSYYIGVPDEELKPGEFKTICKLLNKSVIELLARIDLFDSLVGKGMIVCSNNPDRNYIDPVN